jgi:hypothetical protein
VGYSGVKLRIIFYLRINRRLKFGRADMQGQAKKLLLLLKSSINGGKDQFEETEA